MKHERAHNVISGVNNVLSSPIMRRSMGSRKTHSDTMVEEKGAGGRIVKFMPVVALNISDGAAELGFDISKKS
jgi:hypothetical protein